MPDRDDDGSSAEGVVSDSVRMPHQSSGNLPDGAARRALEDSLQLQKSARNRTSGSQHRASRRRRRPVALVLLATLLVVILIDVLLFVLPAGDQPARADAVVVLGGPGERIEEGEALIRDGYADTLVIVSRTPDNCEPDVPAEQICFTPNPNTTRGEARRVARLAERYGWTSLLVVAQNEQVRRARLRLTRCLPASVDVSLIAVRGTLLQSVYRVVYETAALPKALLFQRHC